MNKSQEARLAGSPPGRGLLLRFAGMAAAVCALVVMLALECDLYSALAQGSPMRFDGMALRELLVAAGMDAGDLSP